MYSISRKTGYKWIERYLAEGPPGLEDRSRRPASSPLRTPDEIVAALIRTRRLHPSWGARKILRLVQRAHPRWKLPHPSTVCDIFSRHGLVARRRRRRTIGHPGRPTTVPDAANQLWAADFKGEFRTRDGIYCYPLTITDGHSRFLLGCQGLRSTAVDLSRPVFSRIFHEYGLLERIRCDNGVPFATNTLGRLSRLSAWWVRLGIRPEFIEPGKPQQNGSHERMHRTLKADATRPPAGSLAAQQRRFNAFRDEFNHVRPHEALDQQPPASCYEPSGRPMPDRVPPLEYPDRFEIRYVSANGGIR